MEIDHVGYAVSDIKKAIDKFMKLGFEGSEIIFDKDRNVKICFMENDNYKIELVTPAGKNSPIDEIIKRSGNCFYHMCYKTSNLDHQIQEMIGMKYKVLLNPKEAVAFDGKRVAFLYNLQVGLVELIEG